MRDRSRDRERERDRGRDARLPSRWETISGTGKTDNSKNKMKNTILDAQTTLLLKKRKTQPHTRCWWGSNTTNHQRPAVPNQGGDSCNFQELMTADKDFVKFGFSSRQYVFSTSFQTQMKWRPRAREDEDLCVNLSHKVYYPVHSSWTF